MLNTFDANLTELYYKPETIRGKHNESVPWTRLRIRAESLSASKEQFEKRRVGSSRRLSGVKTVEQAPDGIVTCLLAPRDLDALFENVLMGNWSTRQLNQGNTLKTFSVMLINYNSLGERSCTLFTGCVFYNANFNFQVNSYVSFTFAVVGTGVVRNFQPRRLTLGSSSNNDQFVGLDGRLNLNGDMIMPVTQFTGTFGNAVTVIRRIDKTNPFKLRVNEFSAESSITGVLVNSRLLDTFDQDLTFELDMRVEYKDKAYNFIFPRCLITDYGSPSSGEGAIVATVAITSLYSEAHGSAVIIKRET